MNINIIGKIGKMRNAHKILARKPTGNRPLRKPKCKWQGNINIELKLE
jgi:hypothetical protein